MKRPTSVPAPEVCKKLLKDFKKQYREFTKSAIELAFTNEKIYRSARKKYEQWIKENITSRGMTYLTDSAGMPVSLIIELAGEKIANLVVL